MKKTFGEKVFERLEKWIKERPDVDQFCVIGANGNLEKIDAEDILTVFYDRCWWVQNHGEFNVLGRSTKDCFYC